MRKYAYGLIGVLILITGAVLWRNRSDDSGVVESVQAEAAAANGILARRTPGSGPGVNRGREPLTSSGAAGAAGSGGLLERPAGRVAPQPATATPSERPQARPASAATSQGGDEIRISAPPVGRALEQEVEVAAALFHLPPARFHAWIDGRGEALHEDRHLLAMAFSAALGGTRQDWGPVRQRLAASPAVSGREVALFERAIDGGRARAVPAATRQASALEIAMEMDLMWVDAEAALEQRDDARAAGLLSALLMDEIGAPWEADREILAELSEQLAEAQAGHRWNRKGEWPSTSMTVQIGDSLVAMRKRFLESFPDHVVCTGLIDRANSINGRYLQAGRDLRIPLDDVTMLVDLSSRWVFYRFGDEVAAAWPVGIGGPGSPTETGVFAAGDKIPEPPWWSQNGEIPFGDPRNELGTRWIGWDDDLGPTSLGFHGTNAPETIGKNVSSGCVRMHNEDVEELFEILPQGALIYVQE